MNKKCTQRLQALQSLMNWFDKLDDLKWNYRKIEATNLVTKFFGAIINCPIMISNRATYQTDWWTPTYRRKTDTIIMNRAIVKVKCYYKKTRKRTIKENDRHILINKFVHWFKRTFTWGRMFISVHFKLCL